jgi:hypothetical protein
VIERLAANMTALRRRLRHEAFHVFHFVGHGFYRPDWCDGVLVMEGRNGRPQEVTGEELGGLLNEYDLTRLVVLNACEGARSGASEPFSGTAQSLIQQGLPAVVAMQFEITDDAAIVFSHELYGAIADGYPLEAALAEARRAIRDEGNPTEWGTPVLYSRAPDGQLFDLTTRVRISDAGPKAQGDADHKAQGEEEDVKHRVDINGGPTNTADGNRAPEDRDPASLARPPSIQPAGSATQGAETPPEVGRTPARQWHGILAKALMFGGAGVGIVLVVVLIAVAFANSHTRRLIQLPRRSAGRLQLR